MRTSFASVLSRIFVVVLLLGSLSCQKSDDAIATPQTISDRILEDSRFSLLAAAVAYAEIGDALKSAHLTLFAPTNEAFQAAGLTTDAAIKALPKEQLRAMLMYHVLYGSVQSTTIPAGLNSVETASRGVAFLTKANTGAMFINNAQLTQVDIGVANGYVHSIDRLLTPATGSFLTTIQTNPNLTFLLAAINRAGTVDKLLLPTLQNTASTNLITLFAPTNAAFQSAGYKDLAAINAANSQTLANLLAYHIVPGITFSNQFQAGSLNTQLSGSRLVVTVTANQAMVKGAKNAAGTAIKPTDLPANSGVIHVIDQVLQP
ncbi:fasciclin domain-containing protein [Spirosoma areae]